MFRAARRVWNLRRAGFLTSRRLSKTCGPSTKLMQPLILVFLSVLSINSYAGQAPTVRTKPTDDHVVIQRRRIVLVRSRKLAQQFPGKKTAVVNYPVVSGLRNPAVLRRVRSALEFKNIFDYSLDDYRNDSWLSEFTYAVNYNNNYMLDITFAQSGSGAYPDEHSKHFLFNLKVGSVVKAADVFDPSKLKSLAAMVDHKLQDELKQIAKENTDSDGADPNEKETLRQSHESLKFEVQNLDDFSVGPKGITFLYDAGFPHVIQALEPEGRYFFSYSTLREYIKSDGLLGRFKVGAGI